MTQAKSGDTVRIHYVGKLTDGTEFDSSAGRDPLIFQVGSGQIIPGLDRQIEGMEVGAAQTLTIPADEAYGPHDPAKIQSLPRSTVPEDLDVATGMRLQARTTTGDTIALQVVEVSPETIVVDANHPLAGKDLVFDVELVEIVQAA
ncbi:FKBP-type peptidyl-prolyl cis-trans isomerase SlyD [Hartmannibacter diazotrophicus]|uniref:Peptidyl-prolyl cis-trans isomerase n=1 Tax=Hartmannibacter diazotrophicus TaxID=1482074 RepID=A0A2C9DAN8_9HYPH|nr:peptidylprolyl isomerase [Hartmannibacter diazotrophicus]SON57303.1 FKBP-type peptidyl-prolyl cis-trans isomerase SlyD [Hartmannibacter diazotrophicus]